MPNANNFKTVSLAGQNKKATTQILKDPNTRYSNFKAQRSFESCAKG